MSEVKWYRCPGLVTDKKSDGVGKALSGCWLNVGMDMKRSGKGGEVYCGHCGGAMMESGENGLEECPSGVHGLKVYLKRVELDDLPMRGYSVACCYNVECSQRYLDDGAKGSDAEAQGRKTHSGTQYIWKVDTTVKDTWAFGDDVDTGESDGMGERNEAEGKSWRRCLFCGLLMKMHQKPSAARFIFKSTSDRDSGWDWAGPAATFRVYRKDEYEQFVMKKGMELAKR